jgi:hypothetical protein
VCQLPARLVVRQLLDSCMQVGECKLRHRVHQAPLVGQLLGSCWQLEGQVRQVLL